MLVPSETTIVESEMHVLNIKDHMLRYFMNNTTAFARRDDLYPFVELLFPNKNLNYNSRKYIVECMKKENIPILKFDYLQNMQNNNNKILRPSKQLAKNQTFFSINFVLNTINRNSMTTDESESFEEIMSLLDQNKMDFQLLAASTLIRGPNALV